MATRISCPSCTRLLLLPADCTAEVLTCPQCRAEIPNPQGTNTPSPVQAELPPARETSSPPPSIPSPLIPDFRNDDVDFRDNRDEMSKWTVTLSVCGGLGIAYALFGSFVALRGGGIWPLLIVTSVLMVFVLFSTVAVLRRHPNDSMGTLAGRIILGTLSTIGVGVSVVVLLGLATFIVMFVVCLANGAKC